MRSYQDGWLILEKRVKWISISTLSRIPIDPSKSKATKTLWFFFQIKFTYEPMTDTLVETHKKVDSADKPDVYTYKREGDWLVMVSIILRHFFYNLLFIEKVRKNIVFFFYARYYSIFWKNNIVPN